MRRDSIAGAIHRNPRRLGLRDRDQTRFGRIIPAILQLIMAYILVFCIKSLFDAHSASNPMLPLHDRDGPAAS